MTKGMFTQLMEAAENERKVKKPQTDQDQEPHKPRPTKTTDDLLPPALEDLSQVGYNSHSYRFTDSEIRWLRRFSLRISENLDRHISHNTLIRLLLRLADQEWKSDPSSNRLFDLLSQIKD
jgi:hypothetical protein